MSARVGVVQFPGSNCELDVLEAIRAVGGDAEILWHKDRDLHAVDAVVIPGGFAHGDYLRPGALARFAPVMDEVTNFARDGGAVIGICNGFQVLTEAGLLPGALGKNAGLSFRCRPEPIEVVSSRSVLTNGVEVGTVLTIPINHFSGSYTIDTDGLAALVDRDQIVLRYRDNPNGSCADIAAVCSPEGNVVGLMPHPERAYHQLTGSTDGAVLLRTLVGTVSDRV